MTMTAVDHARPLSGRIDLTDPAAARHFMVAMHVLERLALFDWYDSHFLAKFEAAKAFLQVVRPDALAAFRAAFDPLRTPADFAIPHLRDVLDDTRLAELLALVRALPESRLKSYEKAEFGRHIPHDLPALTALQAELAPMVGTLAGEPVEPCYNFLSLYNGNGRCPPHLDAPSAKWTLDLCLEQSHEWPIRFSDVVEWPEGLAGRASDSASRDLVYRQHVLRPNEAILFSGSAQWHYRDAIPAGGHCHLAFLHYHPAGCADLVEPARWAAHFDLPELAVLDMVFDAQRPPVRS